MDYTEVMILKDDGSEVPAKFALKDEDLDLAFVLPVKGVDVNSSEVRPFFYWTVLMRLKTGNS